MKIESVPLLLAMPFYWLCLCNHIFMVSGLCLDDQWSLLLQFKNSLTFDSESNKLQSWNPSDDCCTWMGVTCDKEGHVIGLDLIGESISGGLHDSSALFSLQHLQKLNMADNQFCSSSRRPRPRRPFNPDDPQSYYMGEPYLCSSTISGFSKLEKLTHLNLSHAGFVGQIPIEISQLTRLVTLDLSSGWLELEKPNLQMLVQNLTSIRQLYLDGVSISVQGQELSNALMPLLDLQELSMSDCNLSGPLNSSLTRLENLSVIILDGNNFSSPVPETFANFKNLTTLSLFDCGLTGRFPHKIFQMRTLSVIDVSNNENLLGFFPDFPLSGSLQAISVRNTNFSGALPYSIGNARHLSELDLSDCQFNGTLPNSLSNLTELNHLDLSNNRFTGSMPSFGMAKKLTHLDISYNGISGAIPSSHFEALHNLVSIDLSHNYINGSIPASLFTLSFLQRILLSYNKFSGPMHLNNLSKLRNLTSLDLSYNNLSVNVNVTNVDPSFFPSFEKLYMTSCNLKAFPGFLRNQSTLYSLDLSDNQIQGILPNWIWKLQELEYLNISHNLLTDLGEPLHNLTSSLDTVDLHNNQLQGPILVFPKAATYLDYSRNKFNSVIPLDIGNYLSNAFFFSLSNNNLFGSIPYSFCNAPSLQVLDLSINNISGTIPSCLMTMMTMTGTLGVLNMRMNNVTGPIPDMFPYSCSLRTLDLHGNLLHGPIPKSLANCSRLEVLDLGENHIIGGFPCFLEKISAIRVLVLRNNKFQGSLGCSKADKSWNMIQILDIAFNNFSGKLPGKYMATWEKMMHDEDQAVTEYIKMDVQMGGYYQDSVTIISKGQKMELVKILTVFTSIDFSSNHFDGPIPEELMHFKALHVLNFSNNALSGEIPSSIGNLKQLESLDLSHNSLGGEIPMQLASLSFLSYLNLSFNHLVGKIPTGTQLQSFPASSFEGNVGLFGSPLVEKPGGKHMGLLPQPGCRQLACTIDWNFMSVELGFVFGLGIVIGPLLFWKQWRVWYWKLVEKTLCWIFPQLYLDHVTHRGQRYTVLRWWH